MIWIVAVAINQLYEVSIANIAISIFFLLHWKKNVWKRVLQVGSWLLLPIVFLHACLTPGEVVLSLMDISITAEGLYGGLWLSIHLMEMFLAAMIFSVLLSKSDLLEWVEKNDYIKIHLIVYLILVKKMSASMRLLLVQSFAQWKADGKKYLRLASVIFELFLASTTHARKASVDLWMNWQCEISSLKSHNELLPSSTYGWFAFISVAELGWCIYV
ncbi:MAG: hypothetical protein CO186_07085 [Zetaproteobacteria bacterium CG_4_9_14_3_um_filter_49_83]|nr:MAG: hypothetical protein AUJ56_04945 [Zetaproteobacteria bacterium CG1_02_49_23]PIQ33923.1 MAG: hypothetical protein COW62_03770 [Zetaproteobacteria bacterium CG17_big_fil_post_rev_8_21_14_2_50_50_13]PIV30164.1 MAG: hypothetical protein COS35_08055 [Zetaproteobacteria bacterium CG02_land_8_20_14_3_00_50_9]PIY54854.1 MAG: hypothetical protein COZ00_12475 [Zetaproteobacteria bacterium CG_4_10_14_0_8_um_filter_49_80]PJA35220.1 MAG: hypothetical protein CO186_07085 [Zetaproteobacteria bacterium